MEGFEVIAELVRREAGGLRGLDLSDRVADEGGIGGVV